MTRYPGRLTIMNTDINLSITGNEASSLFMSKTTNGRFSLDMTE